MPRRRLSLALFGLAIVLAIGALVLWQELGSVTRKNFLRIEEGMTPTEVAAILGAPASDPDLLQTSKYGYNQLLTMRQYDFDDLSFVDWSADPTQPELVSPKSYQHWFGPRGIVSVGFHEGRAVSKCWQQRASIFQRAMYGLRDWLRSL
jgi:hypothetical protein